MRSGLVYRHFSIIIVGYLFKGDILVRTVGKHVRQGDLWVSRILCVVMRNLIISGIHALIISSIHALMISGIHALIISCIHALIISGIHALIISGIHAHY